MKKSIAVYSPIILACFCFGFAGTQLYWHNLLAALGFFLASGLSLLLYFYARLVSNLLFANHTMGENMTRLVNDLQKAGIEVVREERHGDAEMTTATLVRKDLH